MEKEKVITSTRAFDSFRARAEDILYGMFPQHFDSGNIKGVHMGANIDSDPGYKGLHKIHGTPSTMASALFCATMDKMIDGAIIDPSVGADGTFGSVMTPTMEHNLSENIKKMASATMDALISKGTKQEEAQKMVMDSLSAFGWYDAKKGKFVTERFVKSVTDALPLPAPLAGLTTPYWNISVIQKVFPQMFLRGYAEQMVSPQGVPNMWADMVQIFTTTFEGQPRVSSVAAGTGEFNTSVAARNRSHTMISDVINLVIDYESPTPNELRITQQPGNWLGGQLIGMRDSYANLMLRTLRNNLYYYGSEIFDGLSQIADRDAAIDPGNSTHQLWGNGGVWQVPLETLWQADLVGGGGQTSGATVLKMFGHLLGNIMESLNFMPVACRVAVSPTVYKVLKFLLTSDAFVQKNPLSFISSAFEYNNKIVGTMATRGLDQTWAQFELLPDPMLAANTPGNPNDFDVMFITFPSWQSALTEDNLQDVLIAPVLIDSMILPSAPGYRDGTVRTNLSRIGSILAPVTESVWRIDGFGVQ